MKNINFLKNQLQELFAKKIFNKGSFIECSPEDQSVCSMVAETQAYMRAIIPKPYYKYSIYDFTGLSPNNEQILSPEIALKAKQKIINYCWGDIDIAELNRIDQYELDKLSIMRKRRKLGHNVAIYSGYSDPTGSFKSEKGGKTFCAALIMKEAIKSRVMGSYEETYEWIEYATLEHMITSYEEVQLSDIRSSDWLVVDNIPPGFTKWKRQSVDAFFMERISDRLPTILVFRFDVTRKVEENLLGVGFSQIIRDENTTIIGLS